MEVHIARDDSTSKVFTVYGLSSAPIAHKARITLLYIATYLNNKYAKPLPENIMYQNIVDWFSAQALS